MGEGSLTGFPPILPKPDPGLCPVSGGYSATAGGIPGSTHHLLTRHGRQHCGKEQAPSPAGWLDNPSGHSTCRNWPPRAGLGPGPHSRLIRMAPGVGLAEWCLGSHNTDGNPWCVPQIKVHTSVPLKRYEAAGGEGLDTTWSCHFL